jgi:CheY-like chemotaxis protein
MPSDKEFVSYVGDAYEHLYDLVYLRAHPLIGILALAPSQPAKKQARALHHVLVEAIDELDPGPQTPAFSNEWRRHRLLMLRYVKGLNPQQVADQIVLSLRHYYRVHKTAIQAIAAILWDRYAIPGSRISQSEPDDVEVSSPSRQELIRIEAARLAQSDRSADVGEVISGLLPLLKEILVQHKLNAQVQTIDGLPGITTSPSLLRQVFLAVLGYLIERTKRATLRIEAKVEGTVVCVRIRVEPPGAVRPGLQTGGEERIAPIEEMAASIGAQIVPVVQDCVIVGFDIHLPATQRTILVVDDNQDVLELFRSYLSPHRYHVVTAQNAQDAIQKASELRPYAITLDLMMPDQDGWDVLQVLLNRPDTQHIPVIIHSVLNHRELAISLGAAGYLRKPVTEQALLSTLQALKET